MRKVARKDDAAAAERLGGMVAFNTGAALEKHQRLMKIWAASDYDVEVAYDIGLFARPEA